MSYRNSYYSRGYQQTHTRQPSVNSAVTDDETRTMIDDELEPSPQPATQPTYYRDYDSPQDAYRAPQDHLTTQDGFAMPQAAYAGVAEIKNLMKNTRMPRVAGPSREKKKNSELLGTLLRPTGVLESSRCGQGHCRNSKTPVQPDPSTGNAEIRHPLHPDFKRPQHPNLPQQLQP